MSFLKSLALILSTTASTAMAQGTFKVTITNGSAMPISPGVLYVNSSARADERLGQAPTTGLVTLCQTGNPATRIAELQNGGSAVSVVQTPGLILPGESADVDVTFDPATANLHFVAMYGKTKDTCAVATILGSRLNALSQGEDSVVQHDEALATGAFLDPMLPAMGDTCVTAASAVACLRELAAMSSCPKIRAFPGYLPSVLTYLEQKYGAADAQTLLLPTSGAVTLTVMSSNVSRAVSK